MKGCGKKKFLVDVFHTYVYSVAVEAEDAAEAHDLARDADAAGKFNPADFRKTDDCDVLVYGEVDNSGPNPWPELET